MYTAMIREKHRFDDMGEEQPDGFLDYHYQGYNYCILVGEQEFRVRTYDDEPGEATVISPTTAQRLAQARSLIQFLIAELGCMRIKLYHAPTGAFRAVNLQTLDFE